jgi:FMN-dependent NADH-azoreductase
MDMPQNGNTLNILKIDASGRREGSASRALTRDIIDALEARHGRVEVISRDLADGVGFVDDRWIDANFTPAEDRSEAQRARLGESDRLVAELEAADVVVIGAPIYNFGVPAALKAWIDMIARARLTFRYTENGPVGLLEGKKAYVVIASGGVPVDSPVDFATPYLRHALGFVGITDVDIIAADRINSRGDEALDEARVRIADLIHMNPLRDASAA